MRTITCESYPLRASAARRNGSQVQLAHLTLYASLAAHALPATWSMTGESSLGECRDSGEVLHYHSLSVQRLLTGQETYTLLTGAQMWVTECHLGIAERRRECVTLRIASRITENVSTKSCTSARPQVATCDLAGEQLLHTCGTTRRPHAAQV